MYYIMNAFKSESQLCENILTEYFQIQGQVKSYVHLFGDESLKSNWPAWMVILFLVPRHGIRLDCDGSVGPTPVVDPEFLLEGRECKFMINQKILENCIE